MFLIVTYLFNKCYYKNNFWTRLCSSSENGNKIFTVSILKTNRYDTQHRTLPATANKTIMPDLRFHNIPKLQQTRSKINCAIRTLKCFIPNLIKNTRDIKWASLGFILSGSSKWKEMHIGVIRWGQTEGTSPSVSSPTPGKWQWGRK